MDNHEHDLKNQTFSSSHLRCSIKTGVLINFAKLIGKHLCPNLFFDKFAGLRYAALLKKRLQHTCFPAHFGKFSRTTISNNICE